MSKAENSVKDFSLIYFLIEIIRIKLTVQLILTKIRLKLTVVLILTG